GIGSRAGGGGTAGAKLTPAEVRNHPGAPLYDEGILRTLFLQFDSPDWEKELADFNNTDVEVPATLTVDGKTYREVGIHFRGASSYFTVGEGRKRSLNVSLDFAHKDQSIDGNKTLNLLNSHEDPSFLRTVLYSHVAREYLPAPRANLVRVVINGENWGIYANAQQFDKHFTQEFFGSTQGRRWKVSGSPNGRGTLAYIGDDPASYKKIYDLKGKDDEKAWKDLIQLTRVLNQTPAAQLEEALAPILDIDGALRFLAVENALINNDGYWIRTSDYALYQDPKGRFHLVPHDMNEAFSRPGGPGFGGGPGGRRGPGGPGGPSGGNRIEGVKLDPLHAAQDPNKPLLSKLLAVPALRERYLAHIRTIAERSLDWQKLGPVASRLHDLIAADVKADGRKLDSTEAFEKSLTQDVPGNGFGPGGGGSMGLKNFADQRRAFLLEYRPKSE
ncbi:MAG: CotH kinase family protein, partial [Verrucomicrobiota bacterium]